MDDERELEMSEEERRYVEELMLFSRAGIKACIFHQMEPEACSGEIRTIGKEPEKDEQGNIRKYGLRMNICEGHFSGEEGWETYTDDEL